MLQIVWLYWLIIVYIKFIEKDFTSASFYFFFQ